MGQKVNPIGLRLGINRTWESHWYASKKDYADTIHPDLMLRKFIMKELKSAGVARVVIERASDKVRINIHTARPGVIIGKKGADIENLKNKVSKKIGSPVSLNIIEIRKPETDAQIVAETIATQLEKRISFRRAMKRAQQSAMRLGVGGIKISCSGRLGGAEIARTEWYKEGRVPLQTLRADIDYGFAEASTTYGIIGVKVWIFKGEVMTHDPSARDNRAMKNSKLR